MSREHWPEEFARAQRRAYEEAGNLHEARMIEIRLHDDARIASDLGRLGLRLADGTLSDGDLRHALLCYERSSWRDDELIGPVRYAHLSPEQRRAYRDVALEAIAARGGTFPAEAGAVWRSDGKRLWKSMIF